MHRDWTGAADALAERLFISTVHTLEIFSIYLGKKLGLYKALDAAECLMPSELARTAGIDPRYAREWLEQQATAGLLEVRACERSAEEREFFLGLAHRAVLCDEDSPMHVAPFAQMIGGLAAALPHVLEAYATGHGVEFSQYGDDLRRGQQDINRSAFTQDLPTRWLPALSDMHNLLQISTGLRIADVGCGAGWSTIALAESYPQHQVWGFDLDAPSIDMARASAEERGSRARFECLDAVLIESRGTFDFVAIFEALHKMSAPDEVLAAIQRSLAPGGVLLVADEPVADQFAPNGEALERMMYGWSILHGLPVSMAQRPSRALGGVLRPAMVRELALAAGFASCELVHAPNELFRLYRLAGPEQP